MNGSSNVNSALAGTALTRHTCYSRENPYSDALGSPSPHPRKVFDAAVVAEQFSWECQYEPHKRFPEQ